MTPNVTQVSWYKYSLGANSWCNKAVNGHLILLLQPLPLMSLFSSYLGELHIEPWQAGCIRHFIGWCHNLTWCPMWCRLVGTDNQWKLILDATNCGHCTWWWPHSTAADLPELYINSAWRRCNQVQQSHKNMFLCPVVSLASVCDKTTWEGMIAAACCSLHLCVVGPHFSQLFEGDLHFGRRAITALQLYEWKALNREVCSQVLNGHPCASRGEHSVLEGGAAPLGAWHQHLKHNIYNICTWWAQLQQEKFNTEINLSFEPVLHFLERVLIDIFCRDQLTWLSGSKGKWLLVLAVHADSVLRACVHMCGFVMCIFLDTCVHPPSSALVLPPQLSIWGLTSAIHSCFPNGLS